MIAETVPREPELADKRSAQSADTNGRKGAIAGWAPRPGLNGNWHPRRSSRDRFCPLFQKLGKENNIGLYRLYRDFARIGRAHRSPLKGMSGRYDPGSPCGSARGAEASMIISVESDPRLLSLPTRPRPAFGDQIVGKGSHAARKLSAHAPVPAARHTPSVGPKAPPSRSPKARIRHLSDLSPEASGDNQMTFGTDLNRTAVMYPLPYRVAML